MSHRATSHDGIENCPAVSLEEDKVDLGILRADSFMGYMGRWAAASVLSFFSL